MTVAASEYFYNKLKKKILSIELEEGEDLLASIKVAMHQNGVKECKVEAINGIIKKGVLNTFNRNHFEAIKLDKSEVLSASGNFKLDFDELYGGLHVLARTSKPMSGTLASGIAAGGLNIKLQFFREDPSKVQARQSQQSVSAQKMP